MLSAHLSKNPRSGDRVSARIRSIRKHQTYDPVEDPEFRSRGFLSHRLTRQRFRRLWNWFAKEFPMLLRHVVEFEETRLGEPFPEPK